MVSKISIKMAGIEIQYEGEHDFLKSELLALVNDLLQLAPKLPAKPAIPQGAAAPTQGGGAVGTVANFAAKLKATTGPELILAALLQSAMVDGTASLKRKGLLEKMKSASPFYKKSYVDNLGSYLKTLVKSGDINEVAESEFALATAKRSVLEPLLADAQ